MKKAICSVLSLLYIDIVFSLISFSSLNNLFTSFIFSLSLGILLTLIDDEKIYYIANIICLSLLSLYAYIQLEFKNLIGVYYSLNSISDGANRIKDQIGYFIKGAKPIYYLVFLSIILFIYLNKKIKIKSDTKKEYKIILCFLLIIVNVFKPLLSTNKNFKESYIYQENFDLLIENVGINHFIFKDIFSLFFPKKYELQIIEENTSEEVKELKKVKDDSKWRKIISNEENETLSKIDTYLINKNYEYENEHTGEFKDYNFIFFLVESFDYIAIDKDLTPTLYKLWNNGYHFTKHYSPIYACATGDSEFVSMTSIYPYRNICTPNNVLKNDFTSSLAGLFKNNGYTVKAYHNWTDQFYTRTKLEYSYGVEDYKDFDSIDFKVIKGWQSDNQLIEKTIDEFINENKFFTFYITSSMHWPYDESSNLGDKYIEEINKYHNDYPIDVKRYLSKSMEFDKALTTLLDRLKEAEKLDNTVISLFSDHRPFKLEANIFHQYTTIINRDETYGTILTPFLIYNSQTKGVEINNVCSTIDHLPTIANLFALNFDPRFYMGDDMFSDDCTVVMNNLDWITNKGYYLRNSNKKSKNLTDEYVNNINANVTNMVNVSKSILNSNYYNYRKDILYPSFK